VNLRLESILKCTPEICQYFCRYCEELPLIISLGESDSEFDWDFDASNDDSEFSNEIMEV
jgi:hypothetical protein